MSAMNGSAASFRRMLGCLVVLAALVSALFASSANASKGSPTPTAYVALGDSLSFGYKEETFAKNQFINKSACEKFEQLACEPPNSFEPGFVGDYQAALEKTEALHNHALTTFNLGCPGETSGGLIGNGPLGSLIEGERAAKSEFSLHVSAPCAYHNVDGFTLKTEQGPASELEAAVGIIKAGVNVNHVSVQIGSNDELASLSKCLNPAYDAEQGFKNFKECVEVEASLAGHQFTGGLFTHIITNIGVVIGTLRHVGYTGPVAILGFYNPQAELLPGSDALQEALNGALGATVAEGKFGPGVAVASIFKTFNPTSTKAEKKAICTFTEECNEFDKKINEEKAVGHAVSAEEAAKFPEGDIHPTAKGYKAMAVALAKAFTAAKA